MPAKLASLYRAKMSGLGLNMLARKGKTVPGLTKSATLSRTETRRVASLRFRKAFRGGYRAQRPAALQLVGEQNAGGSALHHAGGAARACPDNLLPGPPGLAASAAGSGGLFGGDGAAWLTSAPGRWPRRFRPIGGPAAPSQFAGRRGRLQL